MCRQDGVPADFDGAQLGAEAFGYSADPLRNRWDFSSSTVSLSGGKTVATTAELLR